MAIDIKKLAKKATTLAEIMQGREKGETKELIDYCKKYKFVTINDCEMCHISNEDGERDVVWCFTVEEMPEKFFFGGTVIRNMFNSILEEVGGDFTELYSAVSRDNIAVKFTEGKTKSNKPITKVEVL